MLKKIAAIAGTLLAMSAIGTAHAQDKPGWTGPFGGTFTAGMTIASDYSYRGISQTQREFAFQPSFGYETPTLGPIPVTAYVGLWGSNVNFPGINASPEVDINAGFRAKLLDEKFLIDVGYTRYNYLGAPANLQLDLNEFSLVLGYDFGVASVTGAVRYSPNFFANSGIAWYKWAQVSVPLPFIQINEDIAFKVFGTLGSQYVERNLAYGIPRNDYWDWQLGMTVTVYGFDVSVAYTDTNIDRVDCFNTGNCDARAIFSVSKTF